MPEPYTAITFAPVQSFIEKSRKLRDLYGSSFILSFLARALTTAAHTQGHTILSPAHLNLTQGIPNQIIIHGNFPEPDAKHSFRHAWKAITHTCRTWIEAKLTQEHYTWQKDWEQWTNNAWELFYAQGESRVAARETLNQRKLARNWTGINWRGESSTLSGTDAIAFPGMGQKIYKGGRSQGHDDPAIRHFYHQLSQLTALGQPFVDPTEQLSIPELVKRLLTYRVVAKDLQALTKQTLPDIVPASYRDLNRLEENRWTGWFCGDGDQVGKYLRTLPDDEVTRFSRAMLHWGEHHLKAAIDDRLGRIIYAGGDDFLGVLYRLDDLAPDLSPQECLHWFYGFPQLWQQHGNPISVSVGFVWAGPKVPQRDVLQHCRAAEQSAKTHGRDRLALRILFNGGNTLEWVCPWQFLQDILENYRDRNGQTGKSANWTHFYNDVASLQARHAFQGLQSAVAIALFQVYFPTTHLDLGDQSNWLNDPDRLNDRGIPFAGILGNCDRYTLDDHPHTPDPAKLNAALNDWVINLSKLGFHLSHR
jgi:CRISPR-associated protein Cmr2